MSQQLDLAFVPQRAATDETDPDRMQVYDLWHVAMRVPDGPDRKAILDVWHLCHRLLRHAQEIKVGHRFET